MREQSGQHPWGVETRSTGGGGSTGGGWRKLAGRRAVQYRLTTQSITAMFSTVIRRATPSLRQQARLRTSAVAHTQTAAAAAALSSSSSSSSPSKLDEGEQVIYDKLSERFQPSELLVQDVSGTPPSCPHPWRTFSVHSFPYSHCRWLWDLLCHYYCEQGI